MIKIKISAQKIAQNCKRHKLAYENRSGARSHVRQDGRRPVTATHLENGRYKSLIQ